MNWILACILMFISSAGTYLVMRKLLLLKVQTAFINLGLFFIPLLFLTPLALQKLDSFILSPYQFLIIFISAFGFSYLGNKFSVKSIALAPNPGYSLIISKSYVVMTSLLAVLLFHGELTLKSGLAIVLILAFSALIMIDPKQKEKHGEQQWLPLALGAFVCWGMLSLTSKYLLNLGVAILPRIIYVMFIVTIFIVLDIKKEKIPLNKLNRFELGLLVLMGACGAGFNYFMQMGINLAPNVGYVNAVNAASIAAVTIGAIVLFKDEFNWRKMTGVTGVIVGLLLLLL